MGTINTWFYAEIDDGTEEPTKLGSRVKPQRSATFGDADFPAIVVKRTIAVDRWDLSGAEATKIFSRTDMMGPIVNDDIEIVEIWVRARGMNSTIAWDIVTPTSASYVEGSGGGVPDNEIIPWPGPENPPADSTVVAAGSLTLTVGHWQPIMSAGSIYMSGGAKDSLEDGDTRSQIEEIYAICYDDDSTTESAGLIDIVVVMQQFSGATPPQE